MRFNDIQRELCIRPGDSPEETLKSAPLQEKSSVTASALQKQMGQNSSFNPLPTQNSFKIKQEPTLSIQKKNNLQNNKNSDDPRRNTESKPCYFRRNRYSPNHGQSCSAKNVTCKSCGKKGHFAKVGNS